MTPFRRLERQLVAAVTMAKPRVPDAGRLLWRAFIALHNARTVTMAGAQAITHQDIEAYARLVRLPLRPDHVEILRAMDDAWLASARSKTEKADAGSKPARHMSSQEIGPAAFDAMFA